MRDEEDGFINQDKTTIGYKIRGCFKGLEGTSLRCHPAPRLKVYCVHTSR
jgi:hypothetical protein